jgi:hypothetical protein
MHGKASSSHQPQAKMKETEAWEFGASVETLGWLVNRIWPPKYALGERICPEYCCGWPERKIVLTRATSAASAIKSGICAQELLEESIGDGSLYEIT